MSLASDGIRNHRPVRFVAFCRPAIDSLHFLQSAATHYISICVSYVSIVLFYGRSFVLLLQDIHSVVCFSDTVWILSEHITNPFSSIVLQLLHVFLFCSDRESTRSLLFIVCGQKVFKMFLRQVIWL